MIAIVSLVETVAVPFFDFFPDYLLGKIVFFVWCMKQSKNSEADLLFTKVCLLLDICQLDRAKSVCFPWLLQDRT